jgi:hypothetical protein
MFGTEGEDYSTLETIRATGGLAPDSTWERNWKCAQFTAALAQQLGLRLVTFHAGFVPHDETAPGGRAHRLVVVAHPLPEPSDSKE